MSTELKSVKGLQESPEREIELLITRFWGGKSRGVSIQLTLSPKGDGYIELDNQTAKELVKIISEALKP